MYISMMWCVCVCFPTRSHCEHCVYMQTLKFSMFIIIRQEIFIFGPQTEKKNEEEY